MHPLSFNTHLNNLGHVQNWTIMFIWVKYTAKMFAFSFFQQPLKHISELWIKKSAEEMTISYTREVSFDFYFPQSKQTCTTVKAWYKLSNESFSAWPFLFFNPLKEHETIPILLKAQVATSQVPQPTCSWKWHPDTCQLGNPTSSHPMRGLPLSQVLLQLLAQLLVSQNIWSNNQNQTLAIMFDSQCGCRSLRSQIAPCPRWCL